MQPAIFLGLFVKAFSEVSLIFRYFSPLEKETRSNLTFLYFF